MKDLKISQSLVLVAMLLLTFSHFQSLCAGEVDGSVGVGVGNAFGQFGANVELGIAPQIYFTAGAGITYNIGPAANLGFRAYMIDTFSNWRPRITLMFGTAAVFEPSGWSNCYPGNCSFGSYDGGAFRGVTLGIGQQVLFGQKRKHGSAKTT